MMKNFIKAIAEFFKDFDEFPQRLLVIIFFVMLSAILFVPLIELLKNFVSEIVAVALATTLLFGLIGVMGVMIAYYRMFLQPFQIVQGIPALLVGVLIAAFGFGFVLWGWIYNFTTLFR